MSGTIIYRAAASGGWARGIYWDSVDGSTTLGCICGYGNMDTFHYVYIGTGYTHANAPFQFDIVNKQFYCEESGIFGAGIHFGGSSVSLYPYVYNSGTKLYIRCNNTYWCFGETGITKNGTVVLQ